MKLKAPYGMYDKLKRKDDLSCFQDNCMLLRKCGGFAIFILFIYNLPQYPMQLNIWWNHLVGGLMIRAWD